MNRLVFSVMHGTCEQTRFYVGYWTSISKNGVGSIYVLPHKATMKSIVCQGILKNYLLPQYETDHIFQQDNVQYHTTKAVLNYYYFFF